MRFLIVGLGNFGTGVAVTLHQRGHDVRAIDVDAERIERLAPHLSQVFIGDASRPEILAEAKAREVDSAVISTGNDIMASILVAISLRDLGVREIHVKVVSELQARILGKVGVESTVFPERESGELLARRIESKSLLRIARIAPGLSAQEMAVPDAWSGRSLRSLELPRRHGVSVLAVHDALTGELRTIPDPDALLKESDSLLLAGPDEDLEKLVTS
jgi:trk system potassium uptake protein TrkA